MSGNFAQLPVHVAGNGALVALALEEAADAARDYLRSSKSAATRRAYAADARHFQSWCDRHGLEALPAAPETVCAYLAAMARSGLKASSISRRAAAIRFLHRAADLEPPTNSEAVKATLQGIRRSLGTAPVRKAPVTAEVVGMMLEALPEGLKGLRDRALLLLGFAGALRRQANV